MSYVQTPKTSKFGGLILPESTLSTVIRDVVASGYAGSSWNSANPRNKNLIGWEYSGGSADADSLPYADDLRAQSRDLYRNNPLAGSAIRTMTSGVVGTGIRPQAQADAELLQISDDEAAEFNSQAERFFFLWAGSTAGDLRRTLNFWQQQDLVMLTTLCSGDAFTIRRMRQRPGSAFGTCLQVVEGDRCSSPPGREVPNSRIRSGVETDEDGAPLRYWFSKEHPGEIYRRTFDLGEHSSVPAFDENGVRLTLHHFDTERPEQTRGVPYLSPIIETIKQLDRYTEAEITAAVVSGMFSVLVKTDVPQSGFGAIPGSIPGQIGGQQITPQGQGLTRLQSGMIMDLAPGETVEVVNPMRPNTAFDPFVMAVFRQVGARLELPQEVMTKHFTASYSASRAALLEAFKAYRRRRAWLVSSFCAPVWEWVISEAIARGYLNAPGFFDNPLRRAGWLGCKWTGEPMGQIDPLKEAKAATEWMSNGAQTLQDVCASQFGTDWEDVIEQVGRERRRLADLPPNPNNQQPAAAGGADPVAAAMLARED